ncbi:MAG: METTL5 family protein [Candidatus Hodarchaeota archaeon]
MRLSKEQIIDFLKQIPSIEKPNRALEQYSTPHQLAWDIIDLAYKKRDISEKIVWDLGCGTGILAFAAALLGARRVIGIDIDLPSLLIAMNAKHSYHEQLPVHFIASSAEFPGFRPWLRNSSTVVMNPPFGTRRKGIDILFLKLGFQLGRVVYSLHKANQPTQRLIGQLADENGFRIDHRENLPFPIPKMFETHQKELFPVSVDFYRFARLNLA